MWLSFNIWRFPEREWYGSDGKPSPAVQETRVQSLGQEDPLERKMTSHTSILAWIIPWTEEACRLQSMGLQRVRHNWVTSTHTKRGTSRCCVEAHIFLPLFWNILHLDALHTPPPYILQNCLRNPSSNMVVSSHIQLLNTWNVAGPNEDLP